MIDPADLARELAAAYAHGQLLAPPTTRDPAFDLRTAYAVEAELARLRRASGHQSVGRKVGYANKAAWRMFKLDTLVWARMYDDTVSFADRGVTSLSLDGRLSPKIEPEIVFKLKEPPQPGADAASVLAAVEWLALGFEIIDSVFPDWKFQPADFVAAYGLHVALIVGQPRRVEADAIAALAEALPRFEVKLTRNGELVEVGSGKNSLRSPALCVAELAAAIARQPGAEPLRPGELISSGTLTESQRIHAGETWSAAVEGIDLADVSVTAV